MRGIGTQVDAVVFSVWMNILSRVPRSVLWLLAMPAEAVAALTAEAQSRGVHASRLVFGDPTSPESHLKRCVEHAALRPTRTPYPALRNPVPLRIRASIPPCHDRCEWRTSKAPV